MTKSMTSIPGVEGKALSADQYLHNPSIDHNKKGSASDHMISTIIIKKVYSDHMISTIIIKVD